MGRERDNGKEHEMMTEMEVCKKESYKNLVRILGMEDSIDSIHRNEGEMIRKLISWNQ